MRTESILKSRFRDRKRASLEVSEALKVLIYKDYFIASSTATAVATVAPTIGLLPIPIRPIIST